MNSQGRYFLGGILVGVLITVCAALLLGPEVYVTSSANVNNAGRYELTTRQTDGGTEYAVFDTETGNVRILNDDGTWKSHDPNSDEAEPASTEESGTP